MQALRAARRRTKQRVLETLGLAAGSDDSDFEAAHAEYKATINSLMSLKRSMKSHLDALKKQSETAALLSLELATFHRGTAIADSTRELARIQSELDAVATAAAERLYEEEVVAALDMLLWQHPEIEEKVSQRRKLLIDLSAYQRKYESAKSTLQDTQNHPSNAMGSGSTFALSRRKSETEAVEDVATRKIRLDQSEQAVRDATVFLEQHFAELAEKRESGAILDGPVTAFVACQQLMAKRGHTKLETLTSMFPSLSGAASTLHKYEKEYASARAAAGGNALPGLDRDDDLLEEGSFAAFGGGNMDDSIQPQQYQQRRRKAGPCFGQELGSRVPPVVLDCITFLEQRGLATEGLFRVPGSSDVVNELRERYDAGQTGCISDGSALCDASDVATLLKLFFRDLASPLVPFEVYGPLLEAARMAQEDHSISDVRKAELVFSVVLDRIPPANQACLSLLLTFLYRVAQNSEINRMTTANLATCFAPTLIRAPESTSPVKVLSDMQLAIFALKIMIEEARRFPIVMGDSALDLESGRKHANRAGGRGQFSSTAIQAW